MKMANGSFAASKGMTMVEVLLSSVIIILVFAAIFAIYIFVQNTWQQGYAVMKLERDASIAMEKMARGIDGQNGIREAKYIDSPNDGATASTISFTGIDDVVRTFSRSVADSTLRYDEGLGQSIIAENVSSLTFSRTNNLITINLILEEIIRGKHFNVSLMTSVRLRN